MNICFVYKLYPIDKNYDSGIGKYLTNLASELARNNNVIILTTSIKPRVIKSANLTIYALQYPKYTNRTLLLLKHIYNVAIFLPKLVRKYKLDLIEFVNWETEGLLFTLIPNKILKIPVIVRLHTPSFVEHQIYSRKLYFSEKIKEYFEKIFVNQKENHLIASTVFNANKCKMVYQIKKRISIAPLGIKIPSHKEIVPFSHNYPVKILYIGRLEARKGIDILIKAIPKVLSRVTRVKFIIVGRENVDTKWIVKLRNTIEYKYLEKINFLGYVEKNETIKRLYQNADICVFPSRYESFGLTILEAMGFGKPVIASKVGGIPEIIEDRVNGILVRPRSHDLAKNIVALVKNPKLRNKIGKKGRLVSQDKFSIKKMAYTTINYYSSIISLGKNTRI